MIPPSRTDGTTAPREAFTCRICSHASPCQTYLAPEFLYGTKEVFKYFECAQCGCVQHAEIPSDLGRFYPTHYYSYQPIGSGGAWRRFKDRLERKRNRFAFYGKGWIGRFFQAALPEDALPKLRHLNPAKDARIVDVGSGSGRFLHYLADEGYRSLTGVDPFIEKTVRHANGLTVLKQDFMDLEGEWDIIMFNHSLEHIPDNHAILRKAHKLLARDGWLVVEIPTVTSLAWRRYGIYWSSLDAPRHVFLHSLESFRLLAESAGFSIRETQYVSTNQFWASENYRRGRTHVVPRSRWEYVSNRLYRSAVFPFQHFRSLWLNRTGQGDAVAFYLRKG